jgi:hypothetical protein
MAVMKHSAPHRADDDNRVLLEIRSSPKFPRNSEGAFVTLRSGRLVYYYTQFCGGSSDHSAARIAEVHSDDRGRTWSEPALFLKRGSSINVMSVSVLRLRDGRIAMFYCVKNSALDCRPWMRLSADDGATWSKPAVVVKAPGYFVLNNDRVVQTHTGRLIVPVAFHRALPPAPARRRGNDAPRNDLRGIILWYCSDDCGLSWREADSWWALPVPSAAGLQEPGVVELADHSLQAWARTDVGRQYGFQSQDDGLTWTPPRPTKLVSPCAPASIKRLPGSGQLLAVYNDYSGRFPHPLGAHPYGGRTPLVAALSNDGGRTWSRRKCIEDDQASGFTYTAIHFDGDAVLLAYSAWKIGEPHLGSTRIRRLSSAWLQAM